MFKAIRISRFRGFIDVKLEQLGRCNLIIGPNNVGKTSLLEALFLLLGPTNPDLAMMVNGFRGLERFRPNPEDMWGWLFQGKDLSQHIEITARVDARRDRRLIIEIGSGATRIKTGKPNRDIERRRNAATASTSLPPGQLVLTYTNESGQRTVTKTVLKDAGEIGVEREGKLDIPDSVYVSSRGGHAPENAERFSKLAEVGRDGEVLEALQLIEPRLKKLGVLITASGPLLHGDIGIGRMIPLPIMGDGIARLLTILLAILASQNGAVLVDEIENGIHYSRIKQFWKVILVAAARANVQLFATTHSHECVRYAHEAGLEDANGDFYIHRLDREGETVTATTYDQEMMETALESGIEVR